MLPYVWRITVCGHMDLHVSRCPERGLIQLDLPALYKELPRLIDGQRCTQSAHKNRLPQVSYLARYLLFVLDSSLKAVIVPAGSCLCRLRTRERHVGLKSSGQQRFLNMCCPALQAVSPSQQL